MFSADFEMSWAFRYSKTVTDPLAQGRIERQNVPALVDLFDRHGVPVTWATVGHLFLTQCERGPDGRAHKDLPRIGHFENRNWRFDAGDWYDHDPCTDVSQAPEWYAPDLIQQILDADVIHEVGCHTFSHIDFTYERCPASVAEAELRKCQEVAAPFGVRLRSMVFPGGTAGNYEALKKAGFTCYRKPMPYDIDLPYVDDHGLVAIPSTIGLDRDPYGWTEAVHLRMLEKYLEAASRSRMVCHFWFHPSMHPWYLEGVMPGFLGLVESYVRSKRVDVMTMGQLADLVRY